MEHKIKQHILNKSFGLTDFNKTLNKYKDYKKFKTETFFKEFKQNILTHLKDLNYLIELEINNKEVYFIDNFKKGLTKNNINQFKTLINGLTYDINKNFIKCIELDLNKNEIKVYTIILYLKYYNKINNIMKKCFKEYLFNLEKKLILKNL